jgi:hypothetical protein
MNKNLFFGVLGVASLFVFAAGLAAQTGPSAHSYSGVITRIDLDGHFISVGNDNSERTFQLSGDTHITGTLLETGMAGLESLRPGMFVSILYRGQDPVQVADAIDIMSEGQVFQGEEYPFICGTQVC